MNTPKLHVILKKVIAKVIIYTQTATKSIRLFNAYERLKSPPSLTIHFLIINPVPMFSIFDLKFKLNSKL